jgi:hypothetical protein
MAANFAKLPGHPRNYYDALGIMVAGSGELQDQAGRPLGEREKEEEHRDQLLHICYL